MHEDRTANFPYRVQRIMEILTGEDLFMISDEEFEQWYTDRASELHAKAKDLKT